MSLIHFPAHLSVVEPERINPRDGQFWTQEHRAQQKLFEEVCRRYEDHFGANDCGRNRFTADLGELTDYIDNLFAETFGPRKGAENAQGNNPTNPYAYMDFYLLTLGGISKALFRNGNIDILPHYRTMNPPYSLVGFFQEMLNNSLDIGRDEESPLLNRFIKRVRTYDERSHTRPAARPVSLDAPNL